MRTPNETPITHAKPSTRRELPKQNSRFLLSSLQAARVHGIQNFSAKRKTREERESSSSRRRRGQRIDASLPLGRRGGGAPVSVRKRDPRLMFHRAAPAAAGQRPIEKSGEWISHEAESERADRRAPRKWTGRAARVKHFGLFERTPNEWTSLLALITHYFSGELGARAWVFFFFRALFESVIARWGASRLANFRMRAGFLMNGRVEWSLERLCKRNYGRIFMRIFSFEENLRAEVVTLMFYVDRQLFRN